MPSNITQCHLSFVLYCFRANRAVNLMLHKIGVQKKSTPTNGVRGPKVWEILYAFAACFLW